ncbi:MAG: PepSY domain-containing protein [Candidatus Latescibacteria bacterium]|nr:PepSY domain-containing protein [Candidatus Latescibacterota bacterium]
MRMPARRLHRWLGALLLLPLLAVTASGLLLGNPRWLDRGRDPVLRVVADPVRPGVLWQGRASGLWRSADAGGAWREVPMLSPPLEVAGIAVAGDTIWAAGAAGDLVVSRDGGAVWESLPGLPLEGARVRDLGVGPGGALYAWTTRGLFAGADGGRAWTARGDAPAVTPTDRIRALHTGWWLGPRGKLFNDVAAAATILLAVTGLLAWRRRNGRR